MTLIQAVILSVIEGITEFLPVSSTGHLILASKALGVVESEFAKSFNIFIQLGAIMAVVSLYFRSVMRKPGIIKPILISFLPTGVLGAVFYKPIKTYLLGNDILVVATLAAVGVLIILLERYRRLHPQRRLAPAGTLSVARLLMIGLFQSCSMIPGVSRSAATIIGGEAAGLSRKEAVEFSFLLAVPTMAAATGLDVLKSAHAFSGSEFALLVVGFMLSWVTAVLVIKGFVRFVETSTLTNFGIYRIVIALLYLAVFVV